MAAAEVDEVAVVAGSANRRKIQPRTQVELHPDLAPTELVEGLLKEQELRQQTAPAQQAAAAQAHPVEIQRGQ